MSQEAVNFFTHSKNPYTEIYTNIYQNNPNFDPSYSPTFPYLPSLLFWILPFVTLLKDVRYAYIAAEAIVLISFLSLPLQSKPQRFIQKHPLAIELALLWSYFPIHLFITEQAWTDSFLIMIFFFISTLLEFPLAVGVLLGIALGSKQYSFFPALLCVLFFWRMHGTIKTFRTVLVSSGTLFTLLFPFLLWNYQGTLHRWLDETITNKVSLNVLTWTAFLTKNTQFTWSPTFFHVAILISLLGSSLLIVKKSKQIGIWGLCAVTLFSIFSLSFQAFCNYYYFLAAFVWMELISSTRNTSMSTRMAKLT